jgi:hypothetical protein
VAQMKWKDVNPLTWVSRGLNGALEKLVPSQVDQDQASVPSAHLPGPALPVAPTTNGQGEPGQDQASVPSAHLPGPALPVAPTTNGQGEQGQDATIVRGQFVEQTTLDLMTEASQQTQQFRREAESFDEEKASLGEKALRLLFSLLAYLAPSLLAVFIGLAVGDAFTPPGSSFFYSWYAHLLSITLESCLPMLGFVVALTFRRAAKDRSQVAVCAVCCLLFLALGIGNAVVQVFMVSTHFSLNRADAPAILFRSGAPLIVDTISSLYLAITGAKSLKRYLADRRAVMEAVRDMAGINILLEQQQDQAALNRMQALMDMQSKRERAATWNELERIQNKAIVENARRNMQGDDDTGYYRRRRY